MTNAEMDAVQVQNTPVLLERALSPRFKLLSEGLVEATDRTRASHEHLREPFGDMGFIAAVTVKDLGMELTFTISGHLDIFDPP